MTRVTWTADGAQGVLAAPRPGLDPARILDARAEARPVMVVICVHNGGETVIRCVDSVLRWTRDARLVVIDDASTDRSLVTALDDLAATTRLEVVRHHENRGYTRTANHALHLDETSDVVLLNSDTEVGPLWLQRLLAVAGSRRGVATVSAVSDNAGAMAVPVPGTDNDWPQHLPWSEIARAAAGADLPWAVETPTGHGFCMLVTREAIRQLDGFDEEAFPRGYGEENDFSLRATELGMVNLLAPHVLVKHAKGTSFGAEREQLMTEGRRAVDERHPSYTDDVRAWSAGSGMRRVRDAHAALLARLNGAEQVLPARLYVLHSASGGTPATNLDLMTGLAHVQDAYLVEASVSGRLVLHQVHSEGLRTLGTWQAASPFVVTDTFRRDYAEVLTEWILRLGVETVHVRHLINQPLTALPEVCRRLGIPFVLSTHDFYMVCPSIQLLDQNLQFCGGRCTAGAGPCSMPTKFVAQAPDLKHSWIHEWRRRAGAVLENADAVVATTDNAAGILAATYPELAGAIDVIEHGRDIERWSASRPGARAPGPLRLLAIANWAAHKGPEYLRSMARELGESVEVHVMGQKSYLLQDVGVVHGPYQRETLPALVADIDPDLVALVSIWPETYSHTLTEAFALGVPVIATDIGAVAERVRRHGGGLLVPVDDPTAAADAVRRLMTDGSSLAELRASVPRSAVRSRAAMVEDYRALYDRATVPVPRVGVVMPGALGDHPTGTHVRLLRRTMSPAVASRVSVRQVFVDEVLRTGRCPVDVLVVQGGAVPDAAEEFLAVLRRLDVRLVVEVGDDLLSDPATDGRGDGARGRKLRLLVEAADQVVVSTEPAARLLRSSTGSPVGVVEDGLCPRLWSSHVPARGALRPRDETARLLYLGSGTHHADLALLRDVLPEVVRELGRPLRLEVVGGTTEGRAGDWFDEVAVPPGASSYPEFVRWLRSERARWQVAVAPLVDSPSNRVRSDLKLLEYAGLGVPVVASDVGPQHGAHGLARVVPNDPQSWVAVLADLLRDPRLAADAVSDARAVVDPSRMLPATDELWLDTVLGR